jgi:hypothetical protein
MDSGFWRQSLLIYEKGRNGNRPARPWIIDKFDTLQIDIFDHLSARWGLHAKSTRPA